MLAFESWIDPVGAFIAALAAGAANAVAGGGTMISFPVLVWIGLPAVEANATNAVGLWSGSAGGAWSYRARLGVLDARWRWLAAPAIVGGAAGAWLLVNLPPTWFGAVAPFMVIGASVLVALEPLLRRHLAELGGESGLLARATTVLGVLAVSTYGGYFGAGIGIMFLVALALLGLKDLHQANGLKNLLVAGLKGVAVAYFIIRGVLHWPLALVMVVGSAAGGWGAGFLVQKVEAETLRWIVVGAGLAMGAIMMVQRYL